MDTGEMLWKYKTNNQITSSPAIFDKKVYIGSKDFKLYCLNANNGSLIWDYKTDSMIETSPTITDDKVFFSSNGGFLYCLNAYDGSHLWSYDAQSTIWSSPAVTNQSVYFGTHSGYFYCLNIDNGDFIWAFNTTNEIWSSPTISKGKVYFGSNDNFVYCLNALTGDIIWSYEAGGEVHSSPAIAYGNVYIGVLDKGIFCLTADTGNLVWKYLINGGIWSPPSAADSKVYFGTFPCCGSSPTKIRSVDAYTGDLLWQYNTGEYIGMTSSPAIAAGKVFFSTSSGKILVFGEIQFIADANGPYSSIMNDPIQFIGSVYGGKPDYSWFWTFGDGINSTEQNPIHTYTLPGKYTVTLTITDGNNKIATDETIVEINKPSSNNPPDKPEIDGPTNGTSGEEYDFLFLSTDPDGDNIYYWIVWGDGCPAVEWIGPFNSGDIVTVNHTYSKKGTFTISAKTKDIYNEESEWGTLELTIPKSKSYAFNIKIFHRLLLRFQNIFQLLKILY
jgi:outer membrane protein assembly factor BamB/PKD repeat protein